MHAPAVELAHQWFWVGDGGAYTLHTLRALWNRRKRLMLSVFFAVWGPTIAFVLLVPLKYESEMKLFVKRERVDAPVLPDKRTLGPTPADVSESELATEMELFRDRELLERAVEMCRLAPLEAAAPADRRRLLARAAQDLQKDLRVSPIRRTNFISVKYAAEDPNRAAQVLDTLAGLYLEKHAALYRSRESSQFFANQTAYFKQELAEAQKRLAAFQQRHEVSLLEPQKQANLRRIAELEAAIQDTESQSHDAEDRAALLGRQRNALSTTVETQSRTALNQALMDKLKGLLVDLENRRTELLSKYEPSYRLVQEVDREIRDTRAALEREQAPMVIEQTEALNPLRQSTEAELLRTETLAAGLRGRRVSIAQDLVQWRSRQQRLDQITAEHDDLQRQVRIAEDNYLLYQKEQEESRIADAMDRQNILNVSVVERAVPPALPLHRHRSFILLLGFVAAALASFGSGLAAAYFNQPIRSLTELQAVTGLPVLATTSSSKVLCSYAISS